MDCDSAAEVLGVARGASRSQVQSAFRTRVRAAHPDTGGRLDLDVDTLREARDVLLAERARATRAAPPVDAPAASPSAGRPVPPAEQPAAPGTSTGFRWIWATVVGAVGALALAAVVVGVIAIVMSGSTADPRPGPDGPECLVVAAAVEAAPCDAPDAQRVVAELNGRQSCPAGTGTLIAASTTWCLEPVDSS